MHFNIITNAVEILKICRTINKCYGLNNLKTVEDSVRLCLVMVQCRKMIRVMPLRSVYPDPLAPSAKRPKYVQPLGEQVVGAAGIYMFINQEGGIKQYLMLALVIGLAFFFLLFKVWPEWLRVVVYYISWYLLVALVSLHHD